MLITIINASPNNNSSSQTAQIIQAFEHGILEEGAKSETFFLAERTKWKQALEAIENNENIVFVLPVYLGITPSILKEFLEYTDQLLFTQNRESKKIAFILQSAFPEASQRECCEKFLNSFVKHLGCSFSGILSHCVYYGLADNNHFGNLTDDYCYFGKRYIINNASFFFDEVEAFNGEYSLTEKQAKNFVRGFNFMCKLNAEALKASDNLYTNPYDS